MIRKDRHDAPRDHFYWKQWDEHHSLGFRLDRVEKGVLGIKNLSMLGASHQLSTMIKFGTIVSFSSNLKSKFGYSSLQKEKSNQILFD